MQLDAEDTWDATEGAPKFGEGKDGDSDRDEAEMGRQQSETNKKLDSGHRGHESIVDLS